MHIQVLRRSGRSRVIMLAALAVTSAAASGCSWLLPFAILSKHKERVPAEFDKLENKRVAIVVWAEQSTLFDYPHVRMELAVHIGDRLWSAVDGVKVVDGRKIEDYMQRSLINTVDPEEIADKFDAEMIVYLELLEFQIRDPDSPDFLRPAINASVVVYDMTADPDEPKQYELEPVTIEQSGKLFSETSAAQVRKTVYEQFAEQVARKFYKHEVEM